MWLLHLRNRTIQMMQQLAMVPLWRGGTPGLSKRKKLPAFCEWLINVFSSESTATVWLSPLLKYRVSAMLQDCVVQATKLVMGLTAHCTDAVVICWLQVQALDGRTTNVPLGPGPVQPGSTITVRGEGMPISKQPGQKGDLVVNIKVNLPKLSQQQKDQLMGVM